MKKNLINEVRRFQKIAGILTESFNQGMEDIALAHSNTEPNTPPGAKAGEKPTEEGNSYSKPLESLLKNFIDRRGMTTITVGDADWNELVKQIQRQFGRDIPDEGEFFGSELLDILYDMGVKVDQVD